MKLDLSNLRGDIYGGITAGVVALPLALALGVASGLGPIAGLYGAIFVGFFAALFGGTASQISGPTGPMVVVVAGLAASLSGSPELIFTAIVLAGLFQIVFGALGLGSYIRLVPYPVVSGFMSGIGAIIIILQIGRLLGGEPPGGTLPALFYIPKALGDIDFSAVTVGLATLAVVFLWPSAWGRYLPAPLAALLAGTLLGAFVFTGAPILGDIPSALPTLHVPVFEKDAALLVLEANVNGRDLGTLVPEAREWPAPRRLSPTLQGRRDFAQHFMTSALVAALAGTALSDAIGIYKEVDDARGGSGFSFTDLAADRAGTRFGARSVRSAADARAIQDAARDGLADAGLMPPVRDLPEHMAEAEFRRRFGGLDDPRYLRIAEEIERRLDTLTLYR